MVEKKLKLVGFLTHNSLNLKKVRLNRRARKLFAGALPHVGVPRIGESDDGARSQGTEVGDGGVEDLGVVGEGAGLAHGPKIVEPRARPMPGGVEVEHPGTVEEVQVGKGRRGLREGAEGGDRSVDAAAGRGLG